MMRRVSRHLMKRTFARNDWADGYLTETFGANVLEI